MSGEVLKAGIAGYGTVGKIRHQFANQHPNLQVIAVCDQSFEAAVTSPEGFRCWPDYQGLLSESLDVLFVCLPNYLAAEVTIPGLELGLHVFCEKPPGRDLEDIANVIECERRHPGQKLMYGFNHRYHHSVREALRIVRSGELGEIINMRGVYGKSKIIRFDSDWRTKRVFSGGGILLDQGIHMVDMMRLFAQDEFTEIHSSISNSYWHHDVEDNAYALMRTANGVVAMLHSSATSWRHRFHLDLTLSRGAIVLSGILTSTKSYGAETITVVSAGEDDGGDPCEQTTRYNEDLSWRQEISEFAEAIMSDKPIVYGSSMEAFKTMKLVFDIYGADPEWARRYEIQSGVAVGSL